MSKEHGQSQGTNDDPLAQYLRDVSSLPRLTSEEEISLARRIRKGDREALCKLVEGNLRFVVYMAAKYRDSRIPLIDLINEGNIGLLKAAEKFEPDRGVKFITYAVWWVVATIKQALAKKVGVISLPLKHHHTSYKINRKEEELSKQLKRDPTMDELAEALGLSLQAIEDNLRASCTPLSLNASISDDTGISYLDTIKTGFQMDDDLISKNLRKEIRHLVEVLSERERGVITRRFGLDGQEPMTLREIGKIMGLSKERIRQIEDKALGHLRKMAKNRKQEAFLN